MMKKKPYNEFMEEPAALELDPPSRNLGDLPHPGLIAKEDDIPWAEIILEPEHVEDLQRAGGIQMRENSARNSRTTSGPGAKTGSPVAPPIGNNRSMAITDASLDYWEQEDFSPRASVFSGISPVGAAPPIAVLVVIALVVFFFLLQ